MKKLALILSITILGSVSVASPSNAIFGLSHCEKIRSIAKKQDLAAQDLFQQAHLIAAPFLLGNTINQSKLIPVASAFFKIRYGETNYADQNQECYSAKVIAAMKLLQTSYYDIAFKWMNVNQLGITLTNGMVGTFAAGGNGGSFKKMLY